MNLLTKKEFLKRHIPNNLVRRKVIEHVRGLCGVKFKYRLVDIPWSAEVDLVSNTIFLAKRKRGNWQKDTYEELIHDVLHEVVHILCRQRGKWPAYHWADRISTKAQAVTYLRVALKAERWVDREALRWGQELFPGLKAKLVYESKDDVKWFQEEVLNEIRQEWGIRLWKSH